MAARQRAKRQPSARQDAGPRGAAPPRPTPRPERLAFALSLAWLLLVVALAFVMARQGTPLVDMLIFVLVGLAVFLPLVLIWQLVYLLRAAARMEAAAQVLGLQADALAKQASLANRQTTGPGVSPSGGTAGVTAGVTAGAAAGAAADAQQAPDGAGTLRFSSRRHEPPIAGPVAGRGDGEGEGEGDGEGDQAALALADPAGEAVDIGHDELIRALHFPEDEHDSDGFAALRRALGNHATAELIRNAQTVLTGLALEGIYTDELTPEPPRPEIWRAFARGERGTAVAAMGGLRDRSSLALSAARMRSDHDFREAVHRFLRAFERCLRAFEPDASDEQLVRLAQTRSGRAFMLLGRVSGVFR